MIRFLKKALFLGFLGVFASVLIACETTTSTTTLSTTTSITTSETTTTTETTTSESTTTTTQAPLIVPVFLGVAIEAIEAIPLSMTPFQGGPIYDPLDPFGDQDAGTILDVIEAEYALPSEPTIDFYATSSQTFRLILTFDNPDQLEILSFVLNGTAIPFLQFESESTPSEIIYEFTSSDTSGLYDLTIDSFDYASLVEASTVELAANNQVNIAVESLTPAVISVTNSVTNATSIAFDVAISEVDNALAMYYAVLYDGTELVRSVILQTGENHVVFSLLEIQTLYQYAIFQIRNPLNGEGYQLQLDVAEAI